MMTSDALNQAPSKDAERIDTTEPVKGRAARPSEIITVKKSNIPPEVFDAFNELIAQGFTDKISVVYQNAVIDKILSKFEGNEKITRGYIFDNHWLDVEKIYEQAGWKVYYDKPGYNETYAATFTFTAKSS